MLGQREIYSFLQFECKSKIQNDIIRKDDFCYLIFIEVNLYTFIPVTTIMPLPVLPIKHGSKWQW